jgi:hypothetical protein
MSSYSKYLPSGTVPAQIAFAPFALTACQIDFADDSSSSQTTIVRGYNFADELVTRNPGETVIAAEQFQVGVANAGTQKPDQRVACGAWSGHTDNRGAAFFNVNCDHPT